jgi:hypothetical protein
MEDLGVRGARVLAKPVVRRLWEWAGYIVPIAVVISGVGFGALEVSTSLLLALILFTSLRQVAVGTLESRGELKVTRGSRDHLLAILPVTGYTACLYAYNVAFLETQGADGPYPVFFEKLDSFFATSAQVLAGLLVVLAIERRSVEASDAITQRLGFDALVMVGLGAAAALGGLLPNLGRPAYAVLFGLVLAAVVTGFGALLLVANRWSSART